MAFPQRHCTHSSPNGHAYPCQWREKGRVRRWRLGVAPIFPQARARNRFIRIGILGFRNQDLIFWEDKFRACCDELIVWPTKFRPLLSVALSLG